MLQLRENIWVQMYRLRSAIARWRLRNHDFSVICNNCTGAMVLHDLGLRFNTPTVNLYFKADEYILFLQNLKNNLSADLRDVTEDNPFPVGLLNETVHLYFMHYKSFKEAEEAWYRRCRRVNWDNLFIVFVEREGCTYRDLLSFDRLPYKNKVALVHKTYPEIKSAKVIPGYERANEVGQITDTMRGGRHVYDLFDWVDFFNQKNSN